MGYTHYWEIEDTIDKTEFAEIVKDFSRMIKPLSNLGINLGDGFGENKPIININEITFNGLAKCGHEKRNIGLAWPAENASSIAENGQNAVSGQWFAGQILSTRACDGDCSYEGFVFERTDKGFNCCKTNYKPYDIAVQICLIIAKQHLKDKIRVRSDGRPEQWNDAAKMCQNFLNYGIGFSLDIRARL